MPWLMLENRAEQCGGSVIGSTVHGDDRLEMRSDEMIQDKMTLDEK